MGPTRSSRRRSNDGQWHMITYVRSGSLATIYVDGVQVGTYAAAWSKDTITRWSIGQEWDHRHAE